MKTGCKARQYSDQMICGHCGLQWDTNDPDPPPYTPSAKHLTIEETLAKLAELKRILK